jgi:hypothetical protein
MQIPALAAAPALAHAQLVQLKKVDFSYISASSPGRGIFVVQFF